MVSSGKIDVLSELETFLRELEYYRLSRLFGEIRPLPRSQVAYIANLRTKLLRDIGQFKFLIAELIRKEDIEIFEKGGLYSSDMWLRGLKLEFDLTASEMLSYCIDVTHVAIGKLQDDIRRGHRDKQGNVIQKPPTIPTEPPKAFVSHGKESVALTKLEEFLDALGVEPLIVKELPSLDKTVDDKVNYYLRQADCVIILATGDDKVGDKLQPRQNIIHEIGLAQKTHEGKIIYLLEEGTEFPSNIRPKAYERFKQRNMTKAFLYMLKELRAYGILKAVKP